MNYWTIYGFFKKSSASCFYVGQTQDFRIRIRSHTSSGTFNPESDFYAILEKEVSAFEVGEREQHWMDYFRKLGHVIQNKCQAPVNSMLFAKKRYYCLETQEFFPSLKILCEHFGLFKYQQKELQEKALVQQGPISVMVPRDFTDETAAVHIVDFGRSPGWKPDADYQI